MFLARDELRITIMGGLVLITLAVLSGLAFYYVVQHEVESIRIKHLKASLTQNIRLFNSQISHGIEDTIAITALPFMAYNMQLLTQKKNVAQAKKALQKISTSSLFTGATFFDANSDKLTSFGEFLQTPKLRVRLRSKHDVFLLWDKHFILQVNINVHNKSGEIIGKIRTESELLPLNDSIFETVSIGKTCEYAVCATLDKDMQCFPTNVSSKQVFERIPTVIDGQPLPMKYALEGKTGLIFTKDYRQKDVVAAYAPIGDYGLGAVVKVDARELHDPILELLKIITPLLLALIIIGIILLRWLITPLLRKLIQSNHEALKANTLLQESETNLRTVLDSSTIAVIWSDESGSIEYINHSFTNMFGYTLEDIPTVSKWYSSALPDTDYRERIMTLWKKNVSESKLCNKPIAPIDVTITCKDGTTRHTILTAAWAGKRLIANIIDMTAHYRYESKIKKLSSALEQAGESIIITDKEGIIEYVNPSFATMLGFPEEEAIGKKPLILQSGLHNKTFYHEMWHDISHGKVWQGRVIDRKKNGDLLPILMTISPILDDDKHVINYIAIQKNLKEYEDLEEQFYQAQKMEAIGTLVGGIAHDFNNSLAAITGNLYLAKQSCAAVPDALNRLDKIDALAFGAADMIKKLLAFSRKGTLQMSPLDIATLLKDVIKLNRASVPEHINLTHQIADDVMIVHGDPNLLQQVLINIINNARDALAHTEKPLLSISLDRFNVDDAFSEKHPKTTSESMACISICDNGSGIHKEDLTHLFEPFFTTKAVGKGTGLGLAMAYGAIQSHNGVIEISSELNKKTCFQIYLPLLQNDHIEDGAPTSNQVALGHGETILFVDDNQTIITSGKDVLESLGYNVIIAQNGLDAIAAYEKYKNEIDLLILDVVMPKMGGPEALQAIQKINPNIKAMFSTGYDRSQTLQKGICIQKEAVINKPFSIPELSQAIRKILSVKGSDQGK